MLAVWFVSLVNGMKVRRWIDRDVGKGYKCVRHTSENVDPHFLHDHPNYVAYVWIVPAVSVYTKAIACKIDLDRLYGANTLQNEKLYS